MTTTIDRHAGAAPATCAASPGEAAATAPRARIALVGLGLAMLLPSLDTSIANVALPTLARSHGATFHHVQWVVLAYLLAVTTSIVGAGRLGDVLGRRRVLLAGIGLFAAASAVCGAAPTLDGLIVARAAQGVAAAALMALTLAVTREAVAADRVGRAMGLLGTMSAAGTALGPSLGGLLIHAVGWRAIFLINLPLCALAFALIARALPRDRVAAKRSRFDPLGTLLLAATLGAYASAMTTGEGSGATQAALLAAAAIGGALFAVVEARAAAPLIAPALLRQPGVAAGVAMTALVTTVAMASLVIGPFHLSEALGLDTARVGLAMSCGPIAAALAGAPAGRLVDRIGAHRTMLVGLVASAVGCAILAVMPTSLGVPGYLAPLVVVTSGYAVFQAANTTAVMSSGPADQRGVVAGLLQLARNVGLITGAAVMASVFAHASGAVDDLARDAAATAHGTRVTFAVAAALMGMAIVIVARPRRADREAAPSAATIDGPSPIRSAP